MMSIEDTEIDDDLDTGEDLDEQSDDQQQDGGAEESADDHQASAAADDDEEFIIEIEGEEPDPAQDTPAIRQLREANRAQARKLAEYEARLNGSQEIQVGDKPTLESCDYDEGRFETELDAWKERKAAADSARSAQEEEQRKSQELWQGIENKYRASAAQLRVPDFEAKEKRVNDTLPEVTRKAIKAYCDEPAKVIAALGTNSALLDRISEEKDPIKQLVTLVKLEGKMKVKRSRQIEPDKPVTGSAPLQPVDQNKQLERLEKEAERTGDRSKLIAYRRQMKDKAA